MDKDALLYYQVQHPEAGEVLKTVQGLRRSEKIISTYFENFLELMTPDERLHCAIHPCAAKTSRMSSSDPNLQNLPRDDNLVRGAIIADEGHTLISADFGQIEMRMAAHFSGDKNLIETFKKADETGDPFFLQVADQVFGERISKKDPRYTLIKNVGYGRIYNAGVEKLAATAGVTVEQMRPVYQMFSDRFPGLDAFSRKTINEGRSNSSEMGKPYVQTPTGRRLVADPGSEYKLVNYCLAPETRILHADLVWRAIADTQIGDKLVAFDEYISHGKRRRMRTASVEAVSNVVKPSVRVTTNKNTVICSADHMWLTRREKGRRHNNGDFSRIRWVQALDLQNEDTIVSFAEPWEESFTSSDGWVAGMLDGEGWLSKSVLGFVQNEGEVLNRYIAEMNRLGVSYSVSQDKEPRRTSRVVVTNTSDIMRIIGTTRPVRWSRADYCKLWENRYAPRGDSNGDKVINVESVDAQELVSVQTDTRTFIAEGLFSHNCIQGHAAEALKMAAMRLEDADLIDKTLMPIHDEFIFSIPDEDVQEAVPLIEQAMSTDEYAVHIGAEAEVLGKRWVKK
jgi:hypothetical protein